MRQLNSVEASDVRRFVAIVRVRMNSSRLPGKALMPVVGKPLLELLLERLNRARSLDGVVVATTANREDDEIERVARRIGAGGFRGSESDVLGRVLQAAIEARADAIVEICGDCPLIDPEVVDNLVATFRSADCDFASNCLKRTYPRGLDAQVFWTRVLAETDRLTSDPPDREHVSLYIYEHPERFRLRSVESGLPERYWDWRLTIDTAEDLQLIETIYTRLYPENPAFRLHEILGLLDREPELLQMNCAIRQKAVR